MQLQRRGENALMVRHRLRATGVLGERGSGDFQPFRQPVHESIDRLLYLRQGDAGMTKQCQLHGKAQTIGNPRRLAVRS